MVKGVIKGLVGQAEIGHLALEMGLHEEALIPYGRKVVKVRIQELQRLEGRRKGKLILVTGMTPTPAGEGKTTTAIGLGDALRLIGKKVSIALREPSLALAFGLKGSGTGGGLARLVPPDEINLHFTGDFHAVEAAHNFLAAVVDDWLYRGNLPLLDPIEIVWKRAIGVNDRALRQVIVGLGGRANGVPRQVGFEAVACSEIMGILCLSRDYGDLKERLSRIVVGYTRDNKAVTAGKIGASGPLSAILAVALHPNLVQTYGGTPAFVHGGPYANIALGCSSLVATQMALRLSDYVITEAGGATDTGGEKFFNITCRISDQRPSAAVVVASIRALKRQGGVKKEETGENLSAIERGFENLRKHLDNVNSFGVPPVVALNRFETDSAAEIEAVLRMCFEIGVPAAVSEVWAKGGAGGLVLGRLLLEVLGSVPPVPKLTYPDYVPLKEKICLVATRVYGAEGADISGQAAEKLVRFENEGYGLLPVCVAKPHTSLVEGFLEVTDVGLAAGAGYINVYTRDVTTLPGLPEKWAARGADLKADGSIVGLS